MKAFISQTKAIDMLREKTGLSIATCRAAVDAMPKQPDGAREKVHTAIVQETADWTSRVRRDGIAAGTIRPLSARAKAKIHSLR